MRRLRCGAIVFVITRTVHTADHVRRTTESTSDGVIWAGTFAAIVAAVALTLILTEHRAAPLVSTIAFGSLAFGVTATHLAPFWGYFSEPLLFDADADRWALAAAVPEIVAAAWLAVTGLSIVRRNDYRLVASPD